MKKSLLSSYTRQRNTLDGEDRGTALAELEDESVPAPPGAQKDKE